jgi:hypothetical protein
MGAIVLTVTYPVSSPVPADDPSCVRQAVDGPARQAREASQGGKPGRQAREASQKTLKFIT